ncbi:MAG: DNA polymerase III subunit delta [Myxococcota bacterium]
MAKAVNDWHRWLQLQQQGQPPAVVALGGPERAFVDEARQWIRQQTLQRATQPFNWDRYRIGSCNMQQLVTAVRTKPVLASRRLVEIDADALTAATAKPLQQVIKESIPSTCLVFIFGHAPTKQPLWSAVRKQGNAFVFHNPKPYEMPQLIQQRAQCKGLKLSAAACDMLLQCVGCNVLLVDRAVETLALLHSDNTVTPQDVCTYIAQVPLDDVFALSQAIAARQTTQAFTCLARLQQSADLPLRLVAVWAWQLRQVLHAKLLQQQQKSPHEMSQILHVAPQRLHQLLQLARMGSLRLHCKRLCQLRALDKAIKTSAAPAWLHLHAAVLSLCNSR